MDRAPAKHLSLANDAMRRHAWAEALGEFSAADSDEPLDSGSLEDMATAAFWSGHADDSLKAWERAYSEHLKRGDRRRGAAAALQVARRQAWRLNLSQARGWRATAGRLLSDNQDCRERGQLLNQLAYSLIVQGEFNAAYDRAAEAFEVGARCSARDVQAAALNLEGQALVRAGEIERGLSLLDESLAAASAGDLDPLETGLLYARRSVCAGILRTSTAPARWPRRQSLGARTTQSPASQVSVASIKPNSTAWAATSRGPRPKSGPLSTSCCLARCHGQQWHSTSLGWFNFDGDDSMLPLRRSIAHLSSVSSRSLGGLWF
jgi:hypothetical protein